MDAISIFTLILALAAICGLWYQSKQLKNSQDNLKLSQDQFVTQMKADHLQRRREVALQLWDDWENIFKSERRRAILIYLKWIETETNSDLKRQWMRFIAMGGRVSRSEFEKSKDTAPILIKEVSLNNDFSVRELETFRIALVSGLDLMEKIAAAYHYHVADRDILNEAFRDIIVKYTQDLNDFIKELRGNGNAQSGWQILTNLVNDGDWTPQKVRKPSLPSADGKH